MIANMDQMLQAVGQMGRKQRLLESYREKTLPGSPRNLLMFAEGPLAQMRQLQAELDGYLKQMRGVGDAPGKLVKTASVAGLTPRPAHDAKAVRAAS